MATELAAQHTRNYAKRQITWYGKTNFDYIFENKRDEFEKLYDKIKQFIE
jgi:tRNA A37 N6-isopentenylltransferase MiaA